MITEHKLEWVTPKIHELSSNQTDSKFFVFSYEGVEGTKIFGPSWYMTSADCNDNLLTAQQKLKWFSPQISLLDLQKSEGKFPFGPVETTFSSKAATGFASWNIFREDAATTRGTCHPLIQLQWAKLILKTTQLQNLRMMQIQQDESADRNFNWQSPTRIWAGALNDYRDTGQSDLEKTNGFSGKINFFFHHGPF